MNENKIDSVSERIPGIDMQEFKSRYDGKLEPIQLEEIPERIAKELSDRIEKNGFQKEPLSDMNFDLTCKITSGKIEVFCILKGVEESDSIDAQKVSTGVIFFVESIQGEVVGRGEVHMQKLDDESIILPPAYVFSTLTEENHRKSGLGTNRLNYMNAMTHALSGAQLYSGQIGPQSESAGSIWQKLEQEKRAERVKMNMGMRDTV